MEPELTRIANIIRRGGVVAWPTDTTWGLLAACDQPAAISRIYQIKGRPPDKPLQILAADADAAARLVARAARDRRWLTLSRRFWPGPLTLVAPAAAGAPPALVSAGKVGLRVPDDPELRELLRELGGYLAATSLNRSGQPPVTGYREALEFAGEVDYIRPGHAGKTASTVYELPESRLLRRGGVSAAAIAAALEEAWTNA